MDNRFTKMFIPYEDYFGEMELTDKQIDKRIMLAEKLETVFKFVFMMIKSQLQTFDKLNQQVTIDIGYFEEMTGRRFSDALDEMGYDLQTAYPYLAEYSQTLANLIIATTVANITDDDFLSDDRAKFIAENEANSVENYVDFEDAVKDGYTEKEWITLKDKRVRHSHKDVDGVKVGIYDYFEVGDSLMYYPKDSNGEDKEIVNCRCSIKYHK